jgi:hypothetical protein
MKASLCLLSAAVAVCVAPAATPAQGPGEPWRPDMGFPPNWQPGRGMPGHWRPPTLRTRSPFDPPNGARSRGAVGSHGVLPGEPRVSDVLRQKQNAPPASPNASAQVPPEALAQVVNPPKIDPIQLPPAPPDPGVGARVRFEEARKPGWPDLPGWLCPAVLAGAGAAAAAAARGRRKREE